VFTCGGSGYHVITDQTGNSSPQGKAVAIEIAIYNPKLDSDGRAGRTLSSVLARALGTHAP
jgi:arginase